MALMRFENLEPVRHLLTLQQELERIQRNPGFSLGPSGHGAFPALNLLQDRGDGLVVMAELPGVEPGSLNVAGQGRTLTISGERRRETPTDSARYHRRERPFGEFSRSIQLPDDLDLGQGLGIMYCRSADRPHPQSRIRQAAANCRAEQLKEESCDDPRTGNRFQGKTAGRGD
jgi:HSP20 family protein